MKSSSVWPGVSILPFWSVSTARKVNGPSPPGRQSRPDSQPKKNRTFPPGNALLYIRTANDFFQTRRTFRGAPFFCPPVQAVTACPARPSGTVSDRGLLPDSTPRRKRKIRTLLQSEKDSDFLGLVRPGGFEPLAFGVGVQRSIQLSYDRTFMKIVAGTRFIV